MQYRARLLPRFLCCGARRGGIGPGNRSSDGEGGPTMTGPEHYHEAQQLLADPNYGEPKGIGRSETIAAAQVHATLALAAATALGGDSAGDVQAWRDAAATKPAGPHGS
jgi:hypothetical protein